MRSIRFALTLLLFAACESRSTQSTSATPAWLVGDWERTNEKPGKATFESWTKINDQEYHGTSFTLQHTDTLWQENVILHKTGTDWYYTVSQKGETGSTPFKLTAFTSNGFVCENAENEFPKKIEYKSVDAQSFQATISGGDMQVDFTFRKIQSQ